eukprot:scaffold74931_cov23-Tisochrysis_lutea.AAC.4
MKTQWGVTKAGLQWGMMKTQWGLQRETLNPCLQADGVCGNVKAVLGHAVAGIHTFLNLCSTRARYAVHYLKKVCCRATLYFTCEQSS